MNNDINEKIVHAAPVPPFVRFVASAVPMVFDNSLSYYEALCALWKWMQDNLVDVINNNATVTEHYIDLDLETRALFNQLKTYVDTYFDNLDVQDEINNKLDAMAEAGTLQEIITTYIQSNVAWTFDTVADMKQATNLVNGSYAQTLGFHSINDGGGALYKITNTGTANEMDIIAVGNLYANLIYGSEINVKQLGAYADDTHDDADIIKRAIALVKNIVIPKGIYLLNSELVIEGSYDTSSYHIDCDGTLHTTATNGLVILGSYHRVYIHKFLGNGSNTLVKFTTNDTYINTGYSQITLQTGASCANAIAFLPTRSGILYNDITFSNLNASNACILFQTDDVNRSYVNENHFTGGRCGNGTGVKMVKGEAQTDKYDGNHFEHLGFEDIDCGIDMQCASRNSFLRCRTSESLNGTYWVKVDEDCFNNYFNFETIPVEKIYDVNSFSSPGYYNTYDGALQIGGNQSASSMRKLKGGLMIFPNTYDFYKYQNYVDKYNQTSGTLDATYYYNDMVFRVGADNTASIVLQLTEAFGRAGITSFYVFIKKLSTGSTFKIRNASDTTDVVRSSTFTAPLENKMYHIQYTPGLSDTGNDWSVTSVFRV